jgi:hypothetical protein
MNLKLKTDFFKEGEMKLIRLFAGILVSISLGAQSLTAQDLPIENLEGPVIVLLVDPEELYDPPRESSTPTTQQESGSADSQAGTLEDLIEQVKQEQMTLNEYEQRVLSIVEREQRVFVEKLKGFLMTDFNKNDPASGQEFVTSVDTIVELVFKSIDDRTFYSRIYLINKLWLEHQSEKPRFDFLDKRLQEESLKIDSRNRKIRQGLIGVTTVAGLGLGAYLGYKAAYSIVKVAANETGLASVSKMALRMGIIVVTATTGAAAGSVAGYLGSDLLLNNSRELLDPIDGDENLKELLEYIDDL